MNEYRDEYFHTCSCAYTLRALLAEVCCLSSIQGHNSVTCISDDPFEKHFTIWMSGEDNLVVTLSTSFPSHLVVYFILAAPNLRGNKLLLQIKDVQILTPATLRGAGGREEI